MQLPAILPLIVLTSCGNDDYGNIENQSDLLIGNWECATQFKDDTRITIIDCNPSTIEFDQVGN